MKISEKQLILLLNIFKDSLNFADTGFSICQENRSKIYNEIINQQSTLLIEVDNDNNPSEHKHG